MIIPKMLNINVERHSGKNRKPLEIQTRLLEINDRFFDNFQNFDVWRIRCNMIWKTRKPNRNKIALTELSLVRNLANLCFSHYVFLNARPILLCPHNIISLAKKKINNIWQILPKRVPRFASYWLRPWHSPQSPFIVTAIICFLRTKDARIMKKGPVWKSCWMGTDNTNKSNKLSSSMFPYVQAQAW